MTYWLAVVAAVNAIGRDDRHYTLMMLRSGRVVARRSGGRERARIVIRHSTPSDFRDEETLRYIADIKGFAVI